MNLLHSSFECCTPQTFTPSDRRRHCRTWRTSSKGRSNTWNQLSGYDTRNSGTGCSYYTGTYEFFPKSKPFALKILIRTTSYTRLNSVIAYFRVIYFRRVLIRFNLFSVERYGHRLPILLDPHPLIALWSVEIWTESTYSIIFPSHVGRKQSLFIR